MAFHIYAMPMVTDARARRPAYALTDLVGLEWTAMDMGAEPYCLVGVVDISDAQHAILAAHADIIALPANLDQAIGAQLATVQGLLEARNIPAGWVTTNTTYRQLIRIIAQMFQFLQRLTGITVSRLFDTGVTLATRFNQLPVAIRTSLVDAATSLGYNTSSLSGTSTLRVILKAMADQWIQIELFLGGQAV